MAASLVNSVGAMLDEPDTREGLVAELPDGTPQLRTPIRFDGVPLPISGRPPRVGEHNEEIRAVVAAATRGSR